MTAKEHLELAKTNLSRLIDNMQRMGMPHGGFSEVMDSLEKINLEEYADIKAKEAYEAAYWLGANEYDLRNRITTYTDWVELKQEIDKEQYKELQEAKGCDHRALISIGNGYGTTFCSMCNTYNPSN